jgi:hypothetical protein
MQGAQNRKVVSRLECFWCLSLFAFCIRLTEKNKILLVGHQPSGPLNLCLICSFLPWTLPGQGPLQSWQVALQQGPEEQRFKVMKFLVPRIYVLVSVWGYGATLREKWANKKIRSGFSLQKFCVQCRMSKSQLEYFSSYV